MRGFFFFILFFGRLYFLFFYFLFIKNICSFHDEVFGFFDRNLVHHLGKNMRSSLLFYAHGLASLIDFPLIISQLNMLR